MKEKLNRLLRNVNPAVLIVLAVLLVNNMLNSNQSIGEWILDQLMILPGIIIGLTFHEAAHGYVSHWLGDPTPKLQGRLSFNPVRHIDPVGFLALFFCGFGWGQPVEINPMYYKHRRRDEFLVSIAGVVTNLIIAVLMSFAIKGFVSLVSWQIYGVNEIIFYVLYYTMTVNIVLMVFNLIPIPPLDGFGLVTEIFDLRKYDWYWTIYNNGPMILMLAILFGITDKILTPAVGFFVNLLL